MSLGDYATGLAWFVVTLAAVTAATELLRRRRLAYLTGVERALAQAILVTVGLAAVHLVPLALGTLSRPAVAIAALLAVAAAVAVPRAGDAASGGPAAAPAPAPVAWAAAVAVAGVAGLLVAGLAEAAGRLTEASDLVAFDLPVVGQWIQTGSAWQVTELFPLQTHGTYPHNAHLVLLAAVLPWENDGLLRLAVYPFALLLPLAVYGLGRQLGAARALAAAVGAAVAAVPVVATTPEFAPLDLIGAALFACGLVFLVRGSRTSRRADLVLAGLGIGFAAGAKWYFASAAGALLLAWSIARLVASPRGRRAAGDVLAVLGVAALTGGFWLVRNWVEAGNPLYPVPVRALGVTVWDAAPDLYRDWVGFSLAHYLGDWPAWRDYALPDLRRTLGVGGPLLLVGSLLALALAARRRARAGWPVLALAAAVPLLAAVYLSTPYTAFGREGAPEFTEFNVRYAMPLLIVAGGLCAWLGARGRRAALAVAVVAVLAAAQGVWASTADLGASRLAAAALAALLLAGVVSLRRWRKGPASGVRPSRPVVAGAAALAAATAVAGFAEQRAVNRDRYAGADPVLDWVRTNAQDGRRVALTGYFDFQGLAPAWPAFGERIGNRVEFLGPRDGGRVTQHRSRAAWDAARRRGRYDLLVVAQAPSPFWSDAREREWAAASGLVEVARSPRLVLYRGPGGAR